MRHGLGRTNPGQPPSGQWTALSEALRRAVSTAYYAMFHALASSNADIIEGLGRSPTNRTGQRHTDLCATSAPKIPSTAGPISSASRSRTSPSSLPVSRDNGKTLTTTPTSALLKTKLSPGLTAPNRPSLTSTPRPFKKGPWLRSQPSPVSAESGSDVLRLPERI